MAYLCFTARAASGVDPPLRVSRSNGLAQGDDGTGQGQCHGCGHGWLILRRAQGLGSRKVWAIRLDEIQGPKPDLVEFQGGGASWRGQNGCQPSPPLGSRSRTPISWSSNVASKGQPAKMNWASFAPQIERVHMPSTCRWRHPGIVKRPEDHGFLGPGPSNCN